MAVVPCLHAATPLVTQYIAPVTNQTFKAAVKTTSYAKDEGFDFEVVFEANNTKKCVNYIIDVNGEYLTAWKDWVCFTPEKYTEPTAKFKRSVTAPANAPAKRYLYPRVSDVGVDTYGITRGKRANNANRVEIQSHYQAVPNQYEILSNDLDSVQLNATYVQCVHTDWVYQVSFDANGGTGAMSQNPFVYTNSAALPPNAFARTGYRFSAWNTDKNGSGTEYNYNADVAAAADKKTLYAQWNVNTYSVKFNRNGSNVKGSMSVQNFTYDEPKDLYECYYSRSGYTFAGWATDETGEVVYADMDEVVNLTDQNGYEVNLYAKWNGNPYQVLFAKSVEDGVTGTMYPQDFIYGESQALSSNLFDRTGYAFLGWTTVPGSSSPQYQDGQVFSIPTYDAIVTLYAVWGENKYHVTLDQQGGSGGTTDVTVDFGQEIPDVTPPKRDGFSFIGYNDEYGVQYIHSNGKCAKNWDKGSDGTLYAQWSKILFNVSFHANGGTIDGLSDKTISDKYQPGQTYRELPVPEPSTNTLFFAGWWTSMDSTNRIQVVASDIATESVTNLYARWKAVPTENLRTLTFSWGSKPGESISTNAVIGTEFGNYFPSPSPTDEVGRVVLGWYEGNKRVLDTDIVPDKDKVPGDVVLTPHWTIGEFNDAFDCWDIEFSTRRKVISDSKYLYKYDVGKWVYEDKTEYDGEFDVKKWSVVEGDIAQSGAISYAKQSWTALVMTPQTSGNLSLELKTSCSDQLQKSSLAYYVNDNPPITNLFGVMENYISLPERHINTNENVTLEYLRTNEKNAHAQDCAWARNLTWIPDSKPTPIDDWASFVSVTSSVHGAFWTTGGADSWSTVETNTAVAAAGKINNGCFSWIRLDVPAAAGVLEFEWRVSGETGYFDTNNVYHACDFLEFIDESRSSPYSLVLESLTNGFAKVAVTNSVEEAHVFKWRYVKDGDGTDGDDGAWLRNVVWTPGVVDEPTETVIEYEEEGGEKVSVQIPNSWVDEYDLIGATGVSDGDYYAALTNNSGKVGFGGAPLSYWADYIAGTVPTNSASKLKFSGISMTNGVIYLEWDPDWSDPGGAIYREYVIWGKTNLTDAAWHTPTNSASRFFAIEVRIPDSNQ